VDHRILPAGGFAGVQGDRLHQAVALVEDADHRHALGHRRNAGFTALQDLSACRSRLLLLLVRGLRTAGGKRERQRHRKTAAPKHLYSGVHGW
jgi:hypothetical protein